ncbi:DUF3772 domain-containing protein [Thalassococcus sp. CAU 1522]|uniref:DUF3772 domain-containing protein n=1 Tax=Thalassococcus arenae TaxID=2851652 RepID=A0ABS6NB18_9RHOB|nr:DUF3772 domain-containing protein [Thalassococcus arenae]MBV2361173.1 DUF3772 domain-containing protein [Thalassococcus arenae]
MIHALLRCLSITALALGLALSPLSAQSTDAIDYDSWIELAVRAEAVTDAGEASSAALEDLRLDIAGWRDVFLRAQGDNATRIASLQSQIDALGPVPESGEEPAEIATRRAELTAQLARLQQPVRRAEEAYTRADAIIREIDTIIRNRQADELLQLGPSPLNPAFWPRALGELSATANRFGDEVRRNWSSDAMRAEMRANMPLILVLVAIAGVLVTRGQRWVIAGVDWLRAHTSRGTGVWSLMLSLGQIALPLLGIYALISAIFATGMVGQRWTLMLEQVPIWATILLGIRWLAHQVFHPNDDVAILAFRTKERRKARRLANTMSVLIVVKSAIDVLVDVESYDPETTAVLYFPVLLLAGYTLFRLGRLRSEPAQQDAGTGGSESVPYRLRLVRLLGRAAMVVGVVGPVLAAIGYVRVGEALVYPAIATLALAGAVLVLQRLVNDLYHLFTGRDARESDSLWPVLGGFAVALAAAPVLALIWGARVADLTELWARFREGFVFGETRISPTDFLVVIVVFVLGFMLTRLLQGGLRSSVLPRTKIDQGGQNAIVSGVGYIGIFVAAILAITAGGLDLSSLAIVAGALSVGIGFGLQNIVSNFVSGIILLIERPISQGDWIEAGGYQGIVKDISVRSTRIETFDRFDVIVPNADLVSGTVTNFTRGNVLGRIIVPVGVAYGTDTRKVEKILLGIARDHPMVLMNPAPSVYFSGFGADSLDFEIRAVLTDINQGINVRTEMRHRIVELFAEEGIEIPFAQRDVWLRNPEALRGPTSETQAPPAEPEEKDRT